MSKRDIDQRLVPLWEELSPRLLLRLQQRSPSIEKEVAEDIVQDAFKRIYERFLQEDREVYRLLGDQRRMEGYAWAATKNLLNDFYKRVDRHPLVPESDAALEQLLDPVLLEEQFLRSEGSAELQQWIQSYLPYLKEPARSVLPLFLIEQLTLEQVAERRNSSIADTRSTLQRARYQLRDSILADYVQTRRAFTEDKKVPQRLPEELLSRIDAMLAHRPRLRQHTIRLAQKKQRDAGRSSQLASFSPDQSSDLARPALIEQLPEPYRSVLTLSELHQLKDAQIADRLQRPLGTIKGQLSRARERLAVLIGQQQVALTPEQQGEVDVFLSYLAHLSAQDQTVLSLRYVDQLPLADMATRLHLPLGTVKSQLYRARLRFVALYQQNDQEQPLPLLVPQRLRSTHAKPEKLCYIHKLPDHYRPVVELACLHHHSDSKIAALLNLPLGTVKSRLQRGVRLLNSLYE